MSTYEHAEKMLPRSQKGLGERFLEKLLRRFSKPQTQPETLPHYQRKSSAIGLGEHAARAAGIIAAPSSVEPAHETTEKPRTTWSDAFRSLTIAQQRQAEMKENTDAATKAEIVYLTQLLKEKQLANQYRHQLTEDAFEQLVIFKTARDVTRVLEANAAQNHGLNAVDKQLLSHSMESIDWQKIPLSAADSLVGSLSRIDDTRTSHNPDASSITASIRQKHMSESLQSDLYNLQVNGQPSQFQHHFHGRLSTDTQ